MSPDELHLCHQLNKKDQVIAKFKCRKHRQNVLYNGNNLQNKGLELTQLKFSGKSFVTAKLVRKIRGIQTSELYFLLTILFANVLAK